MMEVFEDSELEKVLTINIFNRMILKDPVAGDVLNIVPMNNFKHNDYRMLWGVMKACWLEGLYDVTSIKEAFNKLNNDPLVWVNFYDLVAPFTNVENMTNPMEAAHKINERAERRNIISKLELAVMKLQDPEINHVDLIQSFSKELLECLTFETNELSTAKDDLESYLETNKRFAIDQSSGKLVFFGIPTLDVNVRASVQNIVIVAARPGVGKTAFLIQSLLETIVSGNQSCLFVSLELPKVEALSRIAAYLTNTPQGKFWAGTYSEQDKAIIYSKADSTAKLLIWESPSRTAWSKIEAKIRHSVLHHQIRVVGIDYFGLIGKPDMGRKAQAYELAAELSGRIRALCQELNIAIILLCQLNREGADGMPGMEDLRETGQLEQDAQVILALWKTETKQPSEIEIKTGLATNLQKTDGVITQLKVLKNRNGRAGSVSQLLFDGAVNSFAQMS